MTTVPIRDYPSAVHYLLSLKKHGVNLGLGRMHALLAALDHPERMVPCLHIAGTNGKGSVAAMIAAILRTAGWRVGLYTSPHLVRLGERVQVDGEALTEAGIVEGVSALQPVAEALGEGRPTYFEFMTALAFRHFARSKCAIACIEVGVGGRLDATNVITPEVSVITSIGWDHAEMLGPTLEAIAAEKAGIIKRGRPVVLGRLPTVAERVIREIAADHAAPVSAVAAEWGEDTAAYPRTALAGDHQRGNAATATLAVRALAAHWRINAEVTAKGLATVDWPARWQEFRLQDRRVIVDSAHNADGAAVLDAQLRELRDVTGRPPVAVVGVLGTVRARAIMDVCCRHAREIHLVRPAQARASSFEELESFVPPGFGGVVRRDSVERIFPSGGMCAVGAPGDVVVVAGSIYLAGEVLARLEPQRGPSEGHLQDF